MKGLFWEGFEGLGFWCRKDWFILTVLGEAEGWMCGAENESSESRVGWHSEVDG